ncbi:MAG: TonB-dependent receptor [Acidobacteria bacterium]|nr:TonB-dependent receptor [Acidobacteriota bacterium]
MSNRILILVFTVLLSSLTYGQQASISGRIIDPSGAIVSNAAVHIERASGGGAASTRSNENGTYSLPFLNAAEYVVTIEASGFGRAQKKLEVLVGQSVTLDWQLVPATVSTNVDVSSEALAVSTVRSDVGSNIDSRQMNDLPLNGRNWLELGLLLPGISKNDASNNTLLTGADNGTYQLNVDGQQVGQDIASSGVGQPRYSREALAEFQIITNRFDVTQGRASSTQINAETKSGSNLLHGSAFGYFRNDALNAADPVAHKVLPYSDQQYGGTVGGPIRKDRLFYFGSYEGERNPYTVYTTPTGFGGTTYQVPTKNTTNIYLARLDFQPNESNHFGLRVNGFTFKSPLAGVSGTSHPSQGGKNSLKALSSLLTWTNSKRSNLVNDFKFGFNFFIYANDEVVDSQEYRFGSITVGGNYNYPSPHDQNTFQIRDGVSLLKGKHSIQFGAEYLNTWYYGKYPQYSRGAVTSFSSVPSDLTPYFPVWNDPSTWNLTGLSQIANTYVQGFGNFDINIRRNSVGAWVQDDWRILPRLTLNLGLRYDNDLGLLGNAPRLKSGVETPTVSENHNFAPRIGLAWDLLGDHTTVIRGGAGLYYADHQSNAIYDQQLFNGETTIQASIDATPSAPINLSDPFYPYTGQDFLNGTAPLPRQAIQLLDVNVQTPYAWQSSIGVQRSLGANWVVKADYVHNRTFHEWIRVDQNLFYDPATGYNVKPSVGRPDTRYTSILRFATPSAAGAIYDALLVDVRRRFANHLYVSGSYTLADARDDTDGVFYVPNNQYDIGDGWGRQTGTQRHTFNANGSYELPRGFKLSLLYHFGSGAAFATTAAGSPFGNGGQNRTYLATTTVYNDPRNNHANPVNSTYWITKRNGFTGEPIHRVDARLAKSLTFADRFRLIGQAEVFNLLNHANYGSYQTAITSASYGKPAQNSSLAYSARTIQLSAKFEF